MGQFLFFLVATAARDAFSKKYYYDLFVPLAALTPILMPKFAANKSFERPPPLLSFIRPSFPNAITQ